MSFVRVFSCLLGDLAVRGKRIFTGGIIDLIDLPGGSSSGRWMGRYCRVLCIACVEGKTTPNTIYQEFGVVY